MAVSGDVQAENLLLRVLHFPRPCGSDERYAQSEKWLTQPFLSVSSAGES